MTQEEKDLLLKDLCARLLYGVKCNVNFNQKICVLDADLFHDTLVESVSVKPYLRPMSSMTEEEKKTYSELFWNHDPEHVDWLNEHMFDYRGLIEKGLALKALEGMYKNEKIEFEL